MSIVELGISPAKEKDRLLDAFTRLFSDEEVANCFIAALTAMAKAKGVHGRYRLIPGRDGEVNKIDIVFSQNGHEGLVVEVREVKSAQC